MLTLDEAVRARHSVRNFSNKPVDAAMLRKILDAGRLAPSAKNRQPWRFTVATDAQREAAADLLAAQAGKERAADSTVGATAAIVRAAPVLVAVFLCGESCAPRGGAIPPSSSLPSIQSIGMPRASARCACFPPGLTRMWFCCAWKGWIRWRRPKL